MTINDYQREALRTKNPKVSGTSQLAEGVMGLTGEAGECSDIVKKHVFQGHELDKNHLAIELGDVAWYLASTANAIGYTLEEILQLNVGKLRGRYPDGFDTARSVNRDAE